MTPQGEQTTRAARETLCRSVARRTPSRAAFLCILLGTTLAADDWPQWLGPFRDGTSRERGWLKDWPAEGPPRRWTKEIGSGYSSITISRGRLCLLLC